MDWFVYDNGLRHESVKLLFNFKSKFPTNGVKCKLREQYF